MVILDDKKATIFFWSMMGFFFSFVFTGILVQGKKDSK